MNLTHHLIGMAELLFLLVVIMAAPTFVAVTSIRRDGDAAVKKLEPQVSSAIEEAFAAGVEYAAAQQIEEAIHDLDAND